METAVFLAGKQSQYWNACLQHFLSTRRSPRTRQLYAAVLHAFFGKQPLRNPDQYSQFELLEFLHRPNRGVKHPGEPPSMNTVAMRTTALKSFYKFAATFTVPDAAGRPRILLQSPAPTAGLHIETAPPQPRALSAEQIHAFFQSIDRRDRPGGARDFCVFHLAFVLGLRRSELLRLQWGAIEACTFRDEGQSRPGWRVKVLRKARSAPEWIELPSACYAAICTMLEVQGRRESVQPGDYLFTPIGGSRHGKPTVTRPIDGNTLDSLFHKYRKRAQLPAGLTVHSLRHSSAQQRFRLSPNVEQLRVALGHSSLHTTTRYLCGLIGTEDPVGAQLSEAFADL